MYIPFHPYLAIPTNLLCARDREMRCGVFANMVESRCSILLSDKLRHLMVALASVSADVGMATNSLNDCSNNNIIMDHGYYTNKYDVFAHTKSSDSVAVDSKTSLGSDLSWL